MTDLPVTSLPSMAGATDLTLRHEPRPAAGRWRQIRSVLATGLIGAFVVGTAGLVGGSVANLNAGTGPTPLDGITVVAVVGAVILVAHVARQSRPLRPVPLVPTVVQGWFRRLVELSVFGTGLARTWTATDPTLGLDRLVVPADEPDPALDESSLDTSDATAGPHPGIGPSSGLDRVGVDARTRGAAPIMAQVGSSRRSRSGLSIDELRAGPTLLHTVARGDTWWSLADRYLGDGRHWSALVELNHGRTMAPGQILHDASPLRRGWEIAVPKRDPNE